VVPIVVPPLRERREDIEPLVVHFLQQFAQRDGLPRRDISDAALARLAELEWAGNVRELRNTIERLVILASGPQIAVSDVERLVGRRAVEASGLGSLADCRTFEEFKDAAERAFLLAKLRAFDWNVSETARALEMPRSNLYKKIERYALTRESTPS
jgi:two-component system nitrogen regulation response regulator NtrX